MKYAKARSQCIALETIMQRLVPFLGHLFHHGRLFLRDRRVHLGDHHVGLSHLVVGVVLVRVVVALLLCRLFRRRRACI